MTKCETFAQQDTHLKSDACIVCLLSHGEEGYLFGTDGMKTNLDDIFVLFDNKSCKSLINKPKIFIIQACRGGKYIEFNIKNCHFLYKQYINVAENT